MFFKRRSPPASILAGGFTCTVEVLSDGRRQVYIHNGGERFYLSLSEAEAGELVRALRGETSAYRARSSDGQHKER